MPVSIVTIVLTISTVSSAEHLSSDQLAEYADNLRKSQRACGPKSLWYCLRRLGLQTPYSTVMAECRMDQNGVTLDNLTEAASSLGVRTWPVRISNKRIDILSCPAILVIEGRHCVVFDGLGADPDKIRIFEPTSARQLEWATAAVLAQWSGEAILFRRPQLSIANFSALALSSMFAVLLFAALVKGLAHDGTKGSSKS